MATQDEGVELKEFSESATRMLINFGKTHKVNMESVWKVHEAITPTGLIAAISASMLLNQVDGNHRRELSNIKGLIRAHFGITPK